MSPCDKRTKCSIERRKSERKCSFLSSRSISRSRAWFNVEGREMKTAARHQTRKGQGRKRDDETSFQTADLSATASRRLFKGWTLSSCLITRRSSTLPRESLAFCLPHSVSFSILLRLLLLYASGRPFEFNFPPFSCMKNYLLEIDEFIDIFVEFFSFLLQFYNSNNFHCLKLNSRLVSPRYWRYSLMLDDLILEMFAWFNFVTTLCQREVWQYYRG